MVDHFLSQHCRKPANIEKQVWEHWGVGRRWQLFACRPAYMRACEYVCMCVLGTKKWLSTRERVYKHESMMVDHVELVGVVPQQEVDTGHQTGQLVVFVNGYAQLLTLCENAH